MIKIALIVTLLVLIFSTLFSGLFYLVKDKSSSEKMVRSLTLRVFFSVLLFLSLLLGFKLGLIE
jgi:hypothetical protein